MFDEIRSVFVFFLEILAIVTYMDAMFSRKFKQRWVYALVPVIASILVHITNKLSNEYGSLRLFPFAVLLLIVFIFYKDNIWKRLFCMVIFYVYLYLLDMIVVFAIHLLIRQPIEVIINNNIYGSFAVILSKLILYLTVVLLKSKFQRSETEHISLKEWGLLFLSPITTLVLSIIL